MAMNVPFVGFQPIKTSEHMASFGVFGIIQLFACFGYLRYKVVSHYNFEFLLNFCRA